MSLDNVIAVAAAANGSVPLLVLGLAISVPLIVAGAALIMALLTRLPILVWLGAALLGWIAGDVISTDPAIEPKLKALFSGPVGDQAGFDPRGSINIAHGGTATSSCWPCSASSSCWWSAASGASARWRRWRIRRRRSSAAPDERFSAARSIRSGRPGVPAA